MRREEMARLSDIAADQVIECLDRFDTLDCKIPGNESNILIQKSLNNPPYTSQYFIKKENKLVS